MSRETLVSPAAQKVSGWSVLFAGLLTVAFFFPSVFARLFSPFHIMNGELVT